MTAGHLNRIERIRDLLRTSGKSGAEGARLLLFSSADDCAGAAGLAGLAVFDDAGRVQRDDDPVVLWSGEVL